MIKYKSYIENMKLTYILKHLYILYRITYIMKSVCTILF